MLGPQPRQTPMLGALGTEDRGGAQEGGALGVGLGGEEGRGLTQHALGVPGVLVPGLDPVLHGLGDLVEIHVLHGAVHAAAVVGLSRGGGPHYVSHLGGLGGGGQGSHWVRVGRGFGDMGCGHINVTQAPVCTLAGLVGDQERGKPMSTLRGFTDAG